MAKAFEFKKGKARAASNAMNAWAAGGVVLLGMAVLGIGAALAFAPPVAYDSGGPQPRSER